MPTRNIRASATMVTGLLLNLSIFTGWMWLSGNAMDYTCWCQNMDNGVLDSDPRDNTQPNDSNGGNQDDCVMAK